MYIFAYSGPHNPGSVLLLFLIQVFLFPYQSVFIFPLPTHIPILVCVDLSTFFICPHLYLYLHACTWHLNYFTPSPNISCSHLPNCDHLVLLLPCQSISINKSKHQKKISTYIYMSIHIYVYLRKCIYIDLYVCWQNKIKNNNTNNERIYVYIHICIHMYNVQW